VADYRLDVASESDPGFVGPPDVLSVNIKQGRQPADSAPAAKPTAAGG